MAGTNFPAGLRSRGIPVEPAPLLLTSGDVFHVDSGHALASDTFTGKDPGKPLATIDGAIGKCAASNGDIILVAPGHAETLTAAGAIAADIAGVKIIGMGVGQLRPTITFGTATTASILLSAAGVEFHNFIFVANIDALANPLHVQAADCAFIDCVGRCTSDTVEAERWILTTAAADRLRVRMKIEGRTGGNAQVNAVRLVGCNQADIELDFYGLASTAIVEFLTTACTDIRVKGRMYNSGTTDGSKNVVDTQGSSTWDADIWDAAAGKSYSGGSASALASDDVSAVATSIGTNVDGTTTDTVHGKLGTDTELADRSLYDIINGGGPASAAAAAAPANSVSVYGALRDLWDAVRNGTGGSEPGTNKSLVDALGTDGVIGLTSVFGIWPHLERSALKADGAMLTGDDAIFTVSGGPVYAQIFGLVTTVIGAVAGTLQLQIDTTVPAATVNLSTAVNVEDDAAGTSYRFTGATGVLVPDTNGAKIIDPVTVEDCWFLLPVGTVVIAGSAANTGVIAWHMRYRPLSPLSVVAAAA